MWAIEPQMEGYEELTEKIIAEGVGHIKGFFNAKFVKGNLCINVEDMRRPKAW